MNQEEYSRMDQFERQRYDAVQNINRDMIGAELQLGNKFNLNEKIYEELKMIRLILEGFKNETRGI